MSRAPGVRARGAGLPLEIFPEVPGMDVGAWAAAEREVLARSLAAHGAVAISGFGLSGAADLERFAEASGTALFADYGDLPRDPQGGRVYGATPYPSDRAILFHNESSHQHRFPRRIFFLCLEAPRTGGTTSLVDGRRVLARLAPAARARFATRGLRYLRSFHPGVDVAWQEFFRSSDPARVDERCREEGMVCEWRPGGRLRIAQDAPAVVRHPATGEEAFFNQVLLHHPSRLDAEVRDALRSLLPEDEMPRDVTFGDGTPIPDGLVDEVAAVMEELAVDRPWKAGDVMMVDNLLVAHGRRPFEGTRRVVVAMGDMTSHRALGAGA